MKRKRPSKRQILEFWESGKGMCWRCKQPIINEVYNDGWVLGHCSDPHWLGGIDVAPEHTACNVDDGKLQTTLAAKSVRIRARNIGIKKRFPGWKPSKPKRSQIRGEWQPYTDENGRDRLRWIPPTTGD